MYEVTTIGGMWAPSSGMGAAFDVKRYTTPEVITGAAAGLVLGLVLGAMLAGKKGRR